MGNSKPVTTGGGSAAPLANSWNQFLGSGLTGDYGGSPVSKVGNGFYGNGGNPNGGMGAPGANPNGMQSGNAGFAELINNILKGGGNGSYGSAGPTYQDVPLAAAPTDFSAGPNIDPLKFDAFNAVNPGESDAYKNASGQLGDLSSILKAFAANAGNVDLSGAPGAGSVGAFSSEGILGDRGNIKDAITNAAKTQRGDAIANERARLTATGGMGANSSGAGFAEAIANARSDESLATSLANSDINYRNLDLGAYSAMNNALIGNRSIDADIYGKQLNAKGQGNATALAGYQSTGDFLKSIMSGETDFAKLGLDYNTLNSDNYNKNNLLTSNNYNTSNQLNWDKQLSTEKLNSDNNFNFAKLNSDTAYNNNLLKSTNWNNKATADLTKSGQNNQAMIALLGQLFGSYNQAGAIGTPQANTVMQQPGWLQALTALGGAAQGVAGITKGAKS